MVAYNPGLLAGLRLWLRAKDLGDDNSGVNTWPDQSGLGLNGALAGGATPPVVNTGVTPLGGKAVRFTKANASYLTFSNPLPTPNSDGEIWIVVKADTVATLKNGLWKFNMGYTTPANTYWPNTSTLTSQSFGIDYATGSFTITNGFLQQWHILRVTHAYAISKLKQELDGVLKQDYAYYSFGGRNYWPTGGAWIGRTNNDGSGNPYYFGGWISEVIVRDRISTAQEALDIYAYLKGQHIEAPKEATGLSPIGAKTSYPVGQIPSIDGVSPETSASSSKVIRLYTASGLSPMALGSSDILMADMTAYTGEPNDLIVPLALSGIIDPIYPEPIPPEDFDGLPDPLVAPTLLKSDTVAGQLPPGTYRYSYAAWKGSVSQATAPSPPSDITLTGEDTVTLTYPTIEGADGYLVYREEI